MSQPRFTLMLVALVLALFGGLTLSAKTGCTSSFRVCAIGVFVIVGDGSRATSHPVRIRRC